MNHLLILFHLFHVRRKKNLNLLLCQVQVAGTKRTADAMDRQPACLGFQRVQVIGDSCHLN